MSHKQTVLLHWWECTYVIKPVLAPCEGSLFQKKKQTKAALR